MTSLCESCRYLREVVSGRGSRFLLCLLSQSDKRFPKYPPQPVLKCCGYESPFGRPRPRRATDPCSVRPQASTVWAAQVRLNPEMVKAR